MNHCTVEQIASTWRHCSWGNRRDIIEFQSEASAIPNLALRGADLWRRGGIRTPGRSFSPYNGLANSRFHTLLFGINRLRSDELPHCWTNSHCSEAFVQLLCNQDSNGLPRYAHRALTMECLEDLRSSDA